MKMTFEAYDELFHDIRRNGKLDDNGTITSGNWAIVGYSQNGNEFFGQIYCLGFRLDCENGPYKEPAGI